jgi:beta-lactamase class A
MSRTAHEKLEERIDSIAESAGAERVGVAFHDYGTGQALSIRGSEWFHAASTIKIPVLVGVFGAIAGRTSRSTPASTSATAS